MIGWLRRLFTGEPCCQHEYETVKAQEYKVSGDFGVRWETRYHCRCKRCGWMVLHKLKG